MDRRRISALLCLAGAVLIAWGIFAERWWSARITKPYASVNLKVGLTSLSVCANGRCESADWKKLDVPVDAAGWVWAGRLLFGVGLAAVIALAVTAILAGVPIEVNLPISPPRFAVAFALIAVPLLGVYKLFTPDAIEHFLHTGHSWWLTLAGISFGVAGAWRELPRRFD